MRACHTSSYHSLRAEHETATRYAALEATYWGAEFGLSETERGFIKEERALNTWSQGVTGNAPDLSTAATASSGQSAQRIKRDDDTFTAGQAYLRAARAVRDGKASYAATPSTAVEHDTSAPSDLRDPSEDYLGVGADLTGRPPRREAGRAQAQVDAQAEMPDSSGRQGAVRQGPQQNVDASASEEGELVGELNDDQRWRNRVGTRGQRI